MNTESHFPLELLQEDQENLKRLSRGEINQFEAQQESERISDLFLSHIAQNGFPFLDTQSPEVYKAAIALALHLSPEKLEQILIMLKDEPPARVLPEHKAYLIDKDLIYKGKHQHYGTQFKRNKDGSITFFPIEDEEYVDKRRAEMGMNSLEEYRRYAED